ncbi:MAG: hypothetical protein JO227_22580 [Acetobacteraceae bacterium]|nr:hypothetical protein [Acetobacteraceae bacterium]
MNIPPFATRRSVAPRLQTTRGSPPTLTTTTLWWACLLAISAVLLTPLAVVDVPPLLDYPNHLARAFILSQGAADPHLARMFAPRWGVIPNLGTDILLVPLMQVLPVHVAGRVIVAIALLLPLFGAAAYSKAVFGVRSAWSLGAALVVYNQPLLLGFLNFTIATGGALLLAAHWIRWRDVRPAYAVLTAALGTVALFFCHLMGVVFFAMLAAAYEAEHRGWHARRLLASLTALAPAACLYALSPLNNADVSIGWQPWADKLGQLLVPFVNYNLPLDIFTACAISSFLAICSLTGRCHVPLRSGLAIALFALAFAVSPFAVKGTFGFDTRFIMMLGFLLFAGFLPRLPRPALRLALSLFIALFLVRMTVLTAAWAQYGQPLAELRSVMARVEPGGRVIIAYITPRDAPAYWERVRDARRLSNGLQTDSHMPALLVIERHAYWPFQFDEPTQQPLETLQPYRALAERVGGMPDSSALGTLDLSGFDYLLLLDAGGEPSLATFERFRLTLLRQENAAALFRIRPAR